MKMIETARTMQECLNLGLTPLNTLPTSIQVNGSAIEPSSFVAMVAQLVSAQIGGTGRNFQTSAASTITLTALQNLVQRLTNGGAVTVTLDSAYNIVNTLFNPFVGQTFEWILCSNAATTVATPTLSDTAVTLSGTTTLLAAAARYYQVKLTQVVTTVGAPMTAGTTFTSIARIGSTNNYTVTLGTNALVPVVGSAIYLGVTAGTLPAGWYPINAVTSATSFVIATPPGLWTATAATVPGTILVPSTQYTPGYSGVYSPMLTITGEFATVTAVISV